MSELDDFFFGDPEVLAALDNIERQHNVREKCGTRDREKLASTSGPLPGSLPTRPWPSYAEAAGAGVPQASLSRGLQAPASAKTNSAPLHGRNTLQLERSKGASSLSKGRTGAGPPPAPAQKRGPTVKVTAVLLPGARLGFRFEYNEALIGTIKRIEGREYDAARKLWTVPQKRRDEALRALQSCAQCSVEVEDLPQIVSTVLQAAALQPDESEMYGLIPGDMERQMMEFQREGVKFALSHGGRVLLADEMGLGKTVQAIALMACYKEDWPCLIITPSSLREQWADALNRWLGITDDDIHIVYEKKDTAISGTSFQFLIISYDYVSKMKEDLERRRFQVIVCDESHYIKNHKAVRTKQTVPLLKQARRCILCSGTPALSRPIEILQQMLALLPRAKVTLDRFSERYCQGSRWSKLAGASNLDELHSLCTSTFMKRRLKKDVLDQLPAKMRQQIFLQLTEKDMGPVNDVLCELEKVKQALKQGQHEGGDVSGVKLEEKRLLNKLYFTSAHSKIAAVQEYVNDLLENEEKFLIFAHHQCLLDGIEQCLRKKRVKFIRIDGSTASHERQGLVTSFQENESCKAAVLSIRAAGQGLTLTAAHLVIFAELSWTPGEIVQAEDRAHRIGQADSVSVHFLHARNTIDDIIWQTIQHKLDNVGQTLNGCQEKLQVEAGSCGPRQIHGQGKLAPPPEPRAAAAARRADEILDGLESGAKRQKASCQQTQTLFDVWKQNPLAP
uniref:SWI/SNF-related matrix-associated actin-dependent regulator of chromatin subfamily A-like protein 1 n=1 Tax=Tetraselmis sp. GSL018 TaxID=582737 RepID=A0A061SCW0_9CHLO